MTFEQNLYKLKNELEDSKEYELYLNCNSLKIPIQILEKNYFTLEEHFQKYFSLKANQSLLTFDLQNKIELIEYMAELNRLIHNYVVSTQTLIDQQRINYRLLHESLDNFPEYQMKVDDEFKNNPLCQFIKELRNYFLHKDVPPISASKTLNGITNELKVYLKLDKVKLLNSFNWNKMAKSYIELMEDEVCISDIFRHYHTHVIAFQNWYKEEQKRIFNNEFKFVLAKEKEIKSLGIQSMFEYMLSKRGFSKEMLEEHFLRFVDYEDAKAILETNEPIQRGHKIIKAIEKSIAVPNEIAMSILINYDIFGKIELR